MHYNKETGHFVYGEPNLQVIRDELDLCGYFAIITSEKMDTKEAISLYKNRDASVTTGYSFKKKTQKIHKKISTPY